MNIEQVGVKVGDVWKKSDGHTCRVLDTDRKIDSEYTIAVYELEENGIENCVYCTTKTKLDALLERDGQKVPQAGEMCTGQQWIDVFGGDWEEFKDACKKNSFEFKSVSWSWVRIDKRHLMFDDPCRYRIRLAENQNLPKVDEEPELVTPEPKTIEERLDLIEQRITALECEPVIIPHMHDKWPEPKIESNTYVGKVDPNVTVTMEGE